MTASKVFTAAVARSLSPTDGKITTTQLRLLVVIEELGSTNLSGLAAQLGVDSSTASRTCDQLVKAGLVARRQDSDDRRQVGLSLTRRGTDFLGRIMKRRRDVLARVVEEMSDADRQRLKACLSGFVRAAGGVLDPAFAEALEHGRT